MTDVRTKLLAALEADVRSYHTRTLIKRHHALCSRIAEVLAVLDREARKQEATIEDVAQAIDAGRGTGREG